MFGKRERKSRRQGLLKSGAAAVLFLLSYAAWVEGEPTIHYTVMKRVGEKVSLKTSVGGDEKVLEEKEKKEGVRYSVGLRVTFNIAEQRGKRLVGVDPVGQGIEETSPLMYRTATYSIEGVVYANGVLHTVRNVNPIDMFMTFRYSFFKAFPATPYDGVAAITLGSPNYNSRAQTTQHVPHVNSRLTYILTSFVKETFRFSSPVDLSSSTPHNGVNLEQTRFLELHSHRRVTAFKTNLKLFDNANPFIIFGSPKGAMFWVPIFGYKQLSFQEGLDYIIYGEVYNNGFYHTVASQNTINNHDINFLDYFFVANNRAYKKDKSPSIVLKRQREGSECDPDSSKRCKST